MTDLCDQFLKYLLDSSSSYSSDKMLCCDKEEIYGNGCRLTFGKHCDKEQQLLTQCRKIGEIDCNGRNNSSDKAVADTTCADRNAWLCLATNDVSFAGKPDVQRDWVISKRLLSNVVNDYPNSLKANPRSCGACCNETNCNKIGNKCQCCNGSECDTEISDGCQIPNGKTDCCQMGFDKCSTDKLNETRIGCPDLFQLGKEQACEVFPFPNGTDSIRTINYQTDLCHVNEPKPEPESSNKLSNGDIIGIASGAVSFLVAVVGLFFAYKQLKIAYKDYKKKHKRRSEPESIELTESKKENKSDAEATEQVEEEIEQS